MYHLIWIIFIIVYCLYFRKNKEHKAYVYANSKYYTTEFI